MNCARCGKDLTHETFRIRVLLRGQRQSMYFCGIDCMKAMLRPQAVNVRTVEAQTT